MSFQEGDQVLVWDDNNPKGISRKLHPRWIGPFTVLNRSGAYVYEILYKGKKKVVHARRLIEYQQYLLEDWEKQPASAEDTKEKEREEPAELIDPEDGRLDEMIDLDPPEPQVLSKKEAREAGLKVDRFYFMKLKKELLVVKIVSTEPLCVQFYRSTSKPSATRVYLPVWWNDLMDEEDWSAQNNKNLPAGFEPLTRKIKLVDLLRVKRFALVKRSEHDIPGGKIPARPYKEAKEWLEKREAYFQGVGGRDHTLLKADIMSGGKRLEKSKKKKLGKRKHKKDTGSRKAHKEKKREEKRRLSEIKGPKENKERAGPRRSGRTKKSEWRQLLRISGFKRNELQQEPRKRAKKKAKRRIMSVQPTLGQTRLSAIMENAKALNTAGWRKYQDEGSE